MLALKNSPEEVLKEAFMRFDAASRKLQEKHESLLAEVEGLKKQLEIKDRELKRHEKLALLGETAAALAHEVRNPLGSIKLFVSLLRKDLAGNDEALSLIRNVDRSITALDNVVTNILRFSKKETIDAAVVNLHSIINEQVSHFALPSENNLKFNLKLDAQPFLMANEHSLRQVFYNLLLNSAQALKLAGEISVKTEDSAAGVIIQISDNGPGIKDSIKSRIFEPFVTDKNEGTGLGLAVVCQIVRLHHGTIEAVNLEQGALFTIELPRTQMKGDL